MFTHFNSWKSSVRDKHVGLHVHFLQSRLYSCFSARRNFVFRKDGKIWPKFCIKEWQVHFRFMHPGYYFARISLLSTLQATEFSQTNVNNAAAEVVYCHDYGIIISIMPACMGAHLQCHACNKHHADYPVWNHNVI